MKNLKKISRKELKSLVGGKQLSIDIKDGLSSGGENTYKCCLTLYNCDSTCTTSSNCPSNKFLKAC